MTLSSGTDNIIAALGQSNRVCRVTLRCLAGWQLEEVLAPMKASFPELTYLQLFSRDKMLPVTPDSFLDGSAPRLRIFDLKGLPKLLSSATHLVQLCLSNIPHSEYISPEAMIALLCALSSLDRLILRFQSPQSRPDWETLRRPPSKRSIIPALYFFRFEGAIEYLEDLVTFIDAPQLNFFGITFFNQIDFDCPRLAQFINRTPDLKKRDVHVRFLDRSGGVQFRSLHISISRRKPDLRLSSVAQVCNSCLPPLSMVEDLYIEHEYSQLVWKNDAIENTQWLRLLLPFTAVKNLYLFKEFGPGIAVALQELVGGRITEVLPRLQNILRGSSHRDVCRKTLGSSLPRDSSPVTLSPFLCGADIPVDDAGASRRRSIIDRTLYI
jgi:hypothetical protein